MKNDPSEAWDSHSGLCEACRRETAPVAPEAAASGSDGLAADTQRVTCIQCPMGCLITVTLADGQPTATVGQQCARGAAYARNEVADPRRLLTTLVVVPGRSRPLPVRTVEPIPKPLYFQALAAIHAAEAVPPVRAGDTIIADLAGTGVAVIATDDLD